ncbi:MAG: hypothetical protein HQ501_10110 [Rhodospirillales bacterium]|nr:hypothetical protein [Rhodospirillales bacterium]
MQPKTYIELGDGVQRDASTVVHPNDRTFRNAWQLTGAIIDVDMGKARAIHKDHIRIERASRFDPFDKVLTPLQRRVARGGTMTPQEETDFDAAEAAAQKLRDAPAHASIDTATTPNELKALTLDVLTA